MKPDNVFRFVSVRPPGRRHDEPSTKMIAPASTGEILDTHIANAKAGNSPPEEHAATVASSIVESSDYYTNCADWSPLLKKARYIHGYLREPIESRDLDLFKSRLSEVLKSVLGKKLPLDNIAQSKYFKSLKTSIWLSYYAFVLSTKPVPSTLHDILDWIRFLNLVEAVEDDTLLLTRLTKFHRLRPSMPVALATLLLQRDRSVISKEQQDRDPGAEKKEYEATAVRQVKNKLSRKNKARIVLKALLSEKLAEAKKRADERIREQQQLSPGYSEGSGKGLQSGFRMRQSAPWQINEQDLAERDELRELIEELDIDPARSTLPQLIQRLEQVIASCRSQLADLQSEYIVVPVGGTLARVRRRREQEGG